MTKKFILILFLFVSIASYAQKTLSDYSYVVVPEQFEFVEGKDKFKLNSLTEFLFNKYGFNAYLASEVPNLNRCNGLYANIDKRKAFLRTKVVVTLKDCDGKLIYTSGEGISKYKEFRKAYQDAIRKAFESIEALNVQQKDVEILAAEETMNTENEVPVETKTEAKVELEAEAEIKTSKKESVSTTSNINLPTTKFSNYKKDGKSFLLRKTDTGYSLYKESSEAENGLRLIGTITVTDSEVTFSNTNGETYDAYFDESKNLSLFKGEKVILYKLAH